MTGTISTYGYSLRCRLGPTSTQRIDAEEAEQSGELPVARVPVHGRHDALHLPALHEQRTFGERRRAQPPRHEHDAVDARAGAPSADGPSEGILVDAIGELAGKQVPRAVLRVHQECPPGISLTHDKQVVGGPEADAVRGEMGLAHAMDVDSVFLKRAGVENELIVEANLRRLSACASGAYEVIGVRAALLVSELGVARLQRVSVVGYGLVVGGVLDEAVLPQPAEHSVEGIVLEEFVGLHGMEGEVLAHQRLPEALRPDAHGVVQQGVCGAAPKRFPNISTYPVFLCFHVPWRPGAPSLDSY